MSESKLTEIADYFADFIKIEKAKQIGFYEIDFAELMEKDIAFFDFFSNNPEKVVRLLDIGNIDLFGLEIPIKFNNIPKSIEKEIRRMREKDLNKLLCVKGIVKNHSKIEPRTIGFSYECMECGALITSKIKQAKPKCSCGNKEFFNWKELLSDVQYVKIEEFPEKVSETGQPESIELLFKGKALTSPQIQDMLNFSKRIEIIGIPKKEIVKKDGNYKNRIPIFYIEVLGINLLEEDMDLEITNEDMDKIKEIAKNNPIENLSKSVTPSIFGYELEKEALLLIMAGGVKHKMPDKTSRLGNIHALFCGNPSSGKTILVSGALKLIPRSRYVSGKSSSSVGITASVIKDAISGEFVLEAGALVLSNGSVVGIDEIEKMGMECAGHLNEAMASGTITISKANIQATLKAETSVIAIANPTFSRFDLSKPLATQISIEDKSLLERFDLVFPILDETNKDKLNEKTDFILRLKSIESSIDRKIFMKYIKYCRTIEPEMSEDAYKFITEFYNSLFDKKSNSIPIHSRQLDTLRKLSEASAKLRLSNKVEKIDAERSVKLLKHTMQTIGMDFETGEYDVMRMEGRMPESKRAKYLKIMQIIRELVSRNQKAIIEDILIKAEMDGIDPMETEGIVEELNRTTDIIKVDGGYVTR